MIALLFLKDFVTVDLFANFVSTVRLAMSSSSHELAAGLKSQLSTEVLQCAFFRGVRRYVREFVVVYFDFSSGSSFRRESKTF